MGYGTGMVHLTRREQYVIWLLASLLMTGLAVKVYRTSHRAVPAGEQVKQ